MAAYGIVIRCGWGQPRSGRRLDPLRDGLAVDREPVAEAAGAVADRVERHQRAIFRRKPVVDEEREETESVGEDPGASRRYRFRHPTASGKTIAAAGFVEGARELAQEVGIGGPLLRGSGVAYDIRRGEPYSSYEDFDFRVPVETSGDCLARYRVRLAASMRLSRLSLR